MLRLLQSNLMAQDDFKNLGFADHEQPERQANSEGAKMHQNQDIARGTA